MRGFIFALFAYWSFTDKEHAEGVSAAMGGNGAACTGNHNVCIGRKGFNLTYTSIYDSFITSGMGNKYLVKVYVGEIAHSIFNILRKNG